MFLNVSSANRNKKCAFKVNGLSVFIETGFCDQRKHPSSLAQRVQHEEHWELLKGFNKKIKNLFC